MRQYMPAVICLLFAGMTLAGDIWISDDKDSELTAGFHTRKAEHPRSKELGYDSLYQTACAGFNEIKNPLHDRTELGQSTNLSQHLSYEVISTNDMLYFAWSDTAEWAFTNGLGPTFVECIQHYTVRGDIEIELYDKTAGGNLVTNAVLIRFGELSGGTNQIQYITNTVYDAWHTSDEPGPMIKRITFTSSPTNENETGYNAGAYAIFKLRTQLQAGIQADRNRDGEITADGSEGPAAGWMTESPGLLVCLNDPPEEENDNGEDENGDNDVDDNDKLVMLQLVRRVKNVDVGRAVLEVKQDDPGGEIRIWTNAAMRGEVLLDGAGEKYWNLSEDFLYDDVPQTLWIEGVNTSSNAADVEISFRYEYPAGTILCADTCMVTVVEARLSADVNMDGVIDADDEPDKDREGEPGLLVGVNNKTHTNAAGQVLVNWADDIINESDIKGIDLKRLKLTLLPSLSDG